MAGLDAMELGPDWQLVSEHLNRYLVDSWPAPPWDCYQVNTSAMALSLVEVALAGGLM
jgi:hypothetical protein